MSGSHYAPEPTGPFAPPPSWTGGGLSAGGESTHYDLRTVDAREADRLAQLELRMDNLLDVAERQAQRLRRLEVENVALREAVERHADLLQHYRLEEGI